MLLTYLWCNSDAYRKSPIFKLHKQIVLRNNKRPPYNYLESDDSQLKRFQYSQEYRSTVVNGWQRNIQHKIRTNFHMDRHTLHWHKQNYMDNQNFASILAYSQYMDHRKILACNYMNQHHCAHYILHLCHKLWLSISAPVANTKELSPCWWCWKQAQAQINTVCIRRSNCERKEEKEIKYKVI